MTERPRSMSGNPAGARWFPERLPPDDLVRQLVHVIFLDGKLFGETPFEPLERLDDSVRGVSFLDTRDERRDEARPTVVAHLLVNSAVAEQYGAPFELRDQEE